MTQYDTVVIGGGFYGCRIALRMRERGTVLLLERERTLMARASLLNQARVHNGYHYPRSVLTSFRSRANYDRFASDYPACVDVSFPHYYAVARTSKTSAGQFVQFCGRIGAPLEPAPPDVAAKFNRSLVERVFRVREGAVDAVKLRKQIEGDLARAGVEVRTSAFATAIGSGRVHLESETITTSLILNCTYAATNRFAPEVSLKFEFTELALVEPPPELLGAAVTVIDGPFFSLMPYPPRGLFTLSHVRYTPHRSWARRPGLESSADGVTPFGRDRSAVTDSRFEHMIHDAARYLPCMRVSRYVDSLWEIKTLMPRSEQDDSRPALLRRTGPCITVLGAKIDSVYDVERALDRMLSGCDNGPADEHSAPAFAPPRR